MTISSGTSLGPYVIAGSLGVGGMGEVYRATDTTLERQVAIKVLPDSFAQDAERVARFEREAKTLASLNHNNIAQIYGIERSSVTAIAMELVEGPTLADRIAQGPLPPDEALNIARQILDGLEAAHDRGIVHRDLKPANIKVKADGLVKILDFGIAKSVAVTSSSGGHSPTRMTPAMTEAGVIMGTAAYMSPEQARGKDVDQRTDIWAFGCVLYEMLTGQPAFLGDDVMIVMASILRDKTDLNALPKTLAPSVRNTIKVCLEKDPKKRLHHMGDVRLALAGTFEISAAQSGTRTRWWLPVASAAAGAVVAVAVLQTVAPPAETATAAAAIRRSQFTLPSDHVYTQPNIPEVNISPDGRRMAYSANGAVYVRDMDELDSRIVAGTENDRAVVPIFSPDGNSILYASGGGTGQYKVVSVEGGTPVPILAESPNQGAMWSGANITYGQQNAVMEISPNGGTSTKLVEDAAGTFVMEPVRVPGTELVLYERRTNNSGTSNAAEVVVAAVDSGEVSVLFAGRQPIYVAPGYLVYFEPTLGIVARSFDTTTKAVGNPVVLVSDINYVPGSNGVQFRVAANGSLLYQRGEIGATQGDQVFIANESAIERPLQLPPAGYVYPSVSPDGTQLALQMALDIYVYDLAGNSEPRQLTRDGASRYPVWSPDGQYIAYASARDGTNRIWQQRADGSGVAEPLTAGTAQPQDFPAWAPDGRLTYTTTREGAAGDVLIQSLPLGEPEVLIGGAGDQWGLRFSPAGNAMAYAESGTAGAQVMVQPFPPDGSSVRASQGNTVGARPVWSADGATLYYQRPGASAFAAVDIAVPGFALSNRRDLPFSGTPQTSRVAVMPDGKLVLTIAPTAALGGAAPRTELVVVENWIEEVKQRVPRD